MFKTTITCDITYLKAFTSSSKVTFLDRLENWFKISQWDIRHKLAELLTWKKPSSIALELISSTLTWKRISVGKVPEREPSKQTSGNHQRAGVLIYLINLLSCNSSSRAVWWAGRWTWCHSSISCSARILVSARRLVGNINISYLPWYELAESRWICLCEILAMLFCQNHTVLA